MKDPEDVKKDSEVKETEEESQEKPAETEASEVTGIH